MVTPPGPKRPYDLPPAYEPGRPPTGAALDAGLVAQRRANLDAGSRRGPSTRLVVIAVLVVIIGMVGSCAAIGWSVFGPQLPLADTIRQASDGRARLVLIADVGDSVLVQVILAEGVSDEEARLLVCEVVLPRVNEAGLSVDTIQLVSPTGVMTTMTPGLSDPCPT